MTTKVRSLGVVGGTLLEGFEGIQKREGDCRKGLRSFLMTKVIRGHFLFVLTLRLFRP